MLTAVELRLNLAKLYCLVVPCNLFVVFKHGWSNEIYISSNDSVHVLQLCDVESEPRY